MVSIQRNALILVLALLVTGAGLLDAITGQEWDLAAVLLLLAILQLAIVAGLRTDRLTVRLRPDLADWLRRRSDATGESVEALADRCVAAYRAELAGTEDEGRR